MGKIDDMRRLREQQYADAQQRRPNVRTAEPVTLPAPPVTVTATARDEDAELAQPSRPTRGARPAPPTATEVTDAKQKASKAGGSKASSGSKAGGAVDEDGKCSGCGKTKPVSNGLVAQHQKGFGKACTGSRKAPL